MLIPERQRETKTGRGNRPHRCLCRYAFSFTCPQETQTMTDFSFSFLVPLPRPTGRMCREDGPSRSRQRHEPAPVLWSLASPLSRCPSWHRAQHPLQRGRVCNWGRGISSSVSLHAWKFSQLLLWFLSLTSSFSHFTIRHTPCWAGALLWPPSSLSSPLFPVEVQVLNLLGLLCCSLQQVPLF